MADSQEDMCEMCVNCGEVLAMEKEIDRLNNKLNEDSQTFEISCQREGEKLLRTANDIMLTALEKIALGEGAYARDPLTHAENTIESMLEIAYLAITEVTGRTGT